MRMTIMGALLASALACGAMAQNDDQLRFEVSSIKPPEPMKPGMMIVRNSGGPGSNDPGHMTYTNMSLKNLLMTAYGVKNYQISGPAFLDSERFDIVAKVPEGATKDQVKIMLQNLLKDRFHMEIHHATKELPMYALVVGKGGPKMKESPPDAPAEQNTTGGPNSNPTDAPKPPALTKFSMGPDGNLVIPKGMGPKQGCMSMMMMSPAGPRAHMQCTKQTMADFVGQLANQMDRPVNDMTGLTAKYDFTFDFLPDTDRMMGGPMLAGGAGVRMTQDINVGPGGGHGGGPGPGPDGADSKAEPNAPAPLPAALQEQLGLKFEQKKGPVDMIVVDKMEKVPSEN